MKPTDFKSPFSKGSPLRVLIHDRVWCVPLIVNDADQFVFPGWEHNDLFGNDRPIHVEYCSGNGEWIADKAEQHPEINWLAVEKKFPRVRKIWSKLKNRKLDNLVVLSGEGFSATRSFFPAGSISHVYVNFPDPWPKRRHAGNRLIRPEFMKEIERILVVQGGITLVTDDQDYSTLSIKVMMDNPSFRSCFPEPYFTDNPCNYGSSYFEKLWRLDGRTIRFHQFHKSENACIA